IYAANIRGLKLPGVLELDKDDVLNWHKVCEKGSLIVVDEAQRYWRASRGGGVDEAVIEMETHRHDGIDIVLITQHPGLIHANIRKLVNRHIHMVAYTEHSALRWEAREVREDVQDPSFRATADFEEWKYPQNLYAFYDSAEKHTKKIKLSWRERIAQHGKKIALGLIVVAVAIVAWFFMQVKNGSLVSGSASADAPAALSSPRREGGEVKGPKWKTAAEYVEAQMPRIPSQPWSAPLYDGQQVTAHPQVYCIAKGDDSDCHCITEQGTRYTMALDICLSVAKNGPAYDPFKPERPRETSDRRQGDRPSTPEMSAPVAPSPAVASALPSVPVLMPSGGSSPVASIPHELGNGGMR
ncbi:zonular occludens toxin domain-containing protein, partial [Luteibacter sp.]|uniref:zonular occludens toxin domain-containing protein n=1 Tax=Luteibacter sp. TaxID=1886636 RepID=UPI003F815A01